MRTTGSNNFAQRAHGDIRVQPFGDSLIDEHGFLFFEQRDYALLFAEGFVNLSGFLKDSRYAPFPFSKNGVIFAGQELYLCFGTQLRNLGNLPFSQFWCRQ